MKWHRWAGAAIAAFILLLCATGILLNHSGTLGLAGRFVRSEWLLDFYGVTPPQEIVAFAVDTHWASRIGERIFFDDHELPEQGSGLLGMVRAGDLFVIGLTDRLLLLTQEGQLVETLRDAEGVPVGMRRIGVNNDGRVVIDAAGRLYIPDLGSLRWEEVTTAAADWAQSAPPPPELAARLTHEYRARALSLERILRDLHSGQIVQRAGVWFMDAVALTLMSLVLSGLWIWYRR